MKDVIPHSTEVIPRMTDAIPRSTDIIPRLTDVIPHLSDVIPRMKDVIPHPTDTIPRMKDVIPHPTDTIPRMKDVIPHSTDSIPCLIDAISQTKIAISRLSDAISCMPASCSGFTMLCPHRPVIFFRQPGKCFSAPGLFLLFFIIVSLPGHRFAGSPTRGRGGKSIRLTILIIQSYVLIFNLPKKEGKIWGTQVNFSGS